MDVEQAKEMARAWVEANRGRWPGLRAAHLVGGITALAEDAPFPAERDVDMHLIFAAGSAMLADEGNHFGILEETYGGIAIEAGLKADDLYRSAESVLGNPEIAYHLTVDSVLYDPDGLLATLQPRVRRDYHRRRWVSARLDHERRGLAKGWELLAFAREQWGASGEVNILGYTTSFATAALWVAALQPPKLGGRIVLRLREILAAYGRLDLHEEMLAVLGLADVTPPEVKCFLEEATESFDLALVLRQAHPELAREFGPFQHKLHAHLRPYFVETCRGMLDEGFHREALGWVLPYHLATADVVLAHGPEAIKATIAARQEALLRRLGLLTDAERARAVARAKALYARIFALAEEIAAGHPGIVD